MGSAASCAGFTGLPACRVSWVQHCWLVGTGTCPGGLIAGLHIIACWPEGLAQHALVLVLVLALFMVGWWLNSTLVKSESLEEVFVRLETAGMEVRGGEGVTLVVVGLCLHCGKGCVCLDKDGVEGGARRHGRIEGCGCCDHRSFGTVLLWSSQTWSSACLGLCGSDCTCTGTRLACVTPDPVGTAKSLPARAAVASPMLHFIPMCPYITAAVGSAAGRERGRFHRTQQLLNSVAPTLLLAAPEQCGA